jgi:Pyruvate/2-oxoacid:ferredoxin oxidoreductase delta subunit
MPLGEDAEGRAPGDQPEGSLPGAGSFARSYIISTDCMRCGVCEFMCPKEAIVEAKNQLIILKNVCDGCAECVPYCLVNAIVPRNGFREREAGTLAAQLREALDASGGVADADETATGGQGPPREDISQQAGPLGMLNRRNRT